MSEISKEVKAVVERITFTGYTSISEREDWIQAVVNAATASRDVMIKELEDALEKLKQYAVCNCPENEDAGRVTLHVNCNRHAMPIITKALRQQIDEVMHTK